MTRVAIHGAAGRMGRNLLEACIDDPAVELAAALEDVGHPTLGEDAGVLIGRAPLGIPVSSDPSASEFDAVVDFTRPEGALALVEHCRTAGTPMVIGTTGFTPPQRARVAAAANEIPLVLAPNMGVGVNLLLGLVERAARALGDEYDVEIIEAHHRHKVDAPSGTALQLGEMAAAGRGHRLEDRSVFNRQGHTGERARGTIGFSTVRGGDIVGEHTVLFAGSGERIELTHRASSRMVFAQGAMRAAIWLPQQPPGLYDMGDVLGLSDT
ncbi:MAG: 4-hydroxy-tetrahydrodipicolinate reductase [Halofilum sp. (in: g-proteobacteria)]